MLGRPPFPHPPSASSAPDPPPHPPTPPPGGRGRARARTPEAAFAPDTHTTVQHPCHRDTCLSLVPASPGLGAGGSAGAGAGAGDARTAAAAAGDARTAAAAAAAAAAPAAAAAIPAAVAARVGGRGAVTSGSAGDCWPPRVDLDADAPLPVSPRQTMRLSVCRASHRVRPPTPPPAKAPPQAGLHLPP